MADVDERSNSNRRGHRKRRPTAAGRLLPVVYDELRRLAAIKLSHEAPGQTLDATALVHEAFVRLVEADPDKAWDGRRHFSRRRPKPCAGSWSSGGFIGPGSVTSAAEDRLSLTGRPGRPGAAVRRTTAGPRRGPRAVRDRRTREGRARPAPILAGLSEEQAALALGISRPTASRYWTYARAWLLKQSRAHQRKPRPLAENCQGHELAGRFRRMKGQREGPDPAFAPPCHPEAKEPWS